jgi:hypothetical protein
VVGSASGRVAGPRTGFDLSAHSAFRYRFDLPGRVFTLTLGNGFLVFWLLLLPGLWVKASTDLTSHNTSDLSLQITFLAIGPVVGAACNCIGLYYTRRGPTSMMVDDSGLTFHFTSRAAKRLLWTSPKLELTIHDDRKNSDVSPHLQVCITHPRACRTPIPAEALDAIRSEAVRHGLAVETSRGGNEFDRIRGTSVVHIRRSYSR